MPKFVINIVFTNDNDKRLATRPVHREYDKALYESGKLHESGPFLDDSGALIIYNAESLAEAESILAADPYSITGGIIESAAIHEWNRVIPAES